MSRIALISCMVMNRELNRLISESPNIVRAWWLRQGLHDTPQILHDELQRLIDEIEEENEKLKKQQRFDRIVLGYGLCSNGVIDLHSRSIPVTVARCDDCISLFLGSADRYRELFAKFPGIYWYTPGWIEQSFTPSKENYRLLREEYEEEYDEDTADYLMECNDQWIANYKSCGFITCPLCDNQEYQCHARQAAQDFGWDYHQVEGDLTLMNELINGPWDDERFLTCPPRSRIVADYSNRKFNSIPEDEV